MNINEEQIEAKLFSLVGKVINVQIYSAVSVNIVTCLNISSNNKFPLVFELSFPEGKIHFTSKDVITYYKLRNERYFKGIYCFFLQAEKSKQIQI